MKNLILFTALFSFIFFKIDAQEINSALAMEKCDFEPDAPAVVLFDKAEAKFINETDGFVIYFKRHKRVKIFNEAGFNNGEVSISLYQSERDLETVENLKATTYYYNGKTIEETELDPKNVYKEPINKYWYQKKFALPNLQEGCVIDYSYTVRSPYMFQLPDWDFQSDIPTIYSEYITYMIPFFSYRYRAQGFANFDIFEKDDSGSEKQYLNIKYKDLKITFALKNIPSFKDESFISSKEDYIKKIDFQLYEYNSPYGGTTKIMTDWAGLTKDFLDYTTFGRYIKKAEKVGTKEFSHLAALAQDEQIDAVLDYIKSNYKPNGIINKYASKTIKEFTNEKTGNSANINLLALGILKSLGINAKPVLISTRDHGKVTDSFPFSDLFNDVLILIETDDKVRLLDATDAYCPNDMVPAYCCNGKGYIIENGSERWININNKIPSIHNVSLNYTINPENSTLSGLANVKSTGHISINEEKKYNTDTENFNKYIEDNGLTIKDDIEKIESDKSPKKNFQYQFDFSSDVSVIEDQIIFSPLLKFPVQENPFKQNKRDLPIDLIYPKIISYQAQIKIPEGYKIDQLPSSLTRNSKNITANYKVITNPDGVILITANYQLKKAVYPASTYREIQLLYKLIVENFNQSIVLTRDNNISLL